MSSNDDFIHISTSSSPPTPGQSSSGSETTDAFFKNTHGKRVFTEGVIAESLRSQYPHHHLTITPVYSCDLLAFANSHDDCSYSLRGSDELQERFFVPPTRRYGDANGGAFMDTVQFGSYDFVFQGEHFLLYLVSGYDGLYMKISNNYILVPPPNPGQQMNTSEKALAQTKTDALIQAATNWLQDLHQEVLVFNGGFWQKSKELWSNIQTANWADVILAPSKKASIISDVLGFFSSRDRYAEFGVPWKRGVIFHGPPGNGKTISTKALMHDMTKRLDPTIENLYVKSFNSYGGPERGIRDVFLKARQMAPCLLIFEDIDSLVSPLTRSYFLNEVDGLESNHGILMIGSTNHLERLDPGISKRPSRFDRKYYFGNPDREERVQYAEYWRNKLAKNEKIEFPQEMCGRVADITDEFSFAYMKEAFVAALLVIVARTEEEEMRRPTLREVAERMEDDLNKNILWRELKKQVKALRDEMEDENEEATGTAEETNLGMASASQFWPAMSGVLDGPLPTQPLEIGNRIHDVRGGREDRVSADLVVGGPPLYDMPRYM
ncbi:hypothetical protein HYFRA_00006769 [Hymenoscyphus fraxineus]|uniref:AAA+ ATPase domain-containing protein n=1 Tax=Hymenoscyphus fraxineus TaxID=746836 RepID=A0A9N9KRK3_9HELO|nr:hypothetical protein HYFRA_00006769 [Hymenoscyphus fraxineus]